MLPCRAPALASLAPTPALPRVRRERGGTRRSLRLSQRYPFARGVRIKFFELRNFHLDKTPGF